MINCSLTIGAISSRVGMRLTSPLKLSLSSSEPVGHGA